MKGKLRKNNTDEARYDRAYHGLPKVLQGQLSAAERVLQDPGEHSDEDQGAGERDAFNSKRQAHRKTGDNDGRNDEQKFEEPA